jgi:hypothetical protein
MCSYGIAFITQLFSLRYIVVLTVAEMEVGPSIYMILHMPPLEKGSALVMGWPHDMHCIVYAAVFI